MVSKSTGSAFAMAPTVADVSSGGGGDERDKKSAMMVFKLGRYNICMLNLEMKAKWPS
jgi:hypothetical protein